MMEESLSRFQNRSHFQSLGQNLKRNQLQSREFLTEALGVVRLPSEETNAPVVVLRSPERPPEARLIAPTVSGVTGRPVW
jgi:hypothetical protein